jgi:hypothetical protein
MAATHEFGGTMTKIKKFAGTFVAAGALLAFATPAAQAASPEPFTITEVVPAGGINTFTTTGGTLCPSGTFVDTLVHDLAGSGKKPEPKAEILVRTVYTCTDGSGVFYAQKNISAQFFLNGSSTNTGPITFHGGTGSYTDLTGHGVDNGTGLNGNGVGDISGVLQN